MANQSSSSHPILCASFNQDNSCFAVGTRDRFKIFDCETGRLLYERVIGAFIIVEMLYKTSLLAIVGAGEQPSLSPRRLCLFNTANDTALRELSFLTSILSVCLNRKRLIVVMLEQTYIYDANTLEVKHIIDTVPNSKGVCAFSDNVDNSYLALPADTVRGSVLIYNVMDLQSHCEIHAHRSPLASLAFSSNGMYIATASEHGTIIRVHQISEATKSYSFRRGTYSSTIFSLSFGPSPDLPDILLATSFSGSVHIFTLGRNLSEWLKTSRTLIFYDLHLTFDLSFVLLCFFAFDVILMLLFFVMSRKSNSFLRSIMPASVTDALDPDHHLVFHHAFAAGIRSAAVVRKIDKFSSGPVALRAIASVITFNGHFQEYSLQINPKHEAASWTLEREFNLLLTDSAEQSFIS